LKEALSSSETSVLTRSTQRNIPDDNSLVTKCYCICDMSASFKAPQCPL
jgi:hypothetical protein